MRSFAPAAVAPLPINHPLEKIKLELTPRMTATAVAFLVFWRMWYASLRQLTPDEALYWCWSRHPAIGYLDHPPMIAWLIWLSTRVLGDNELGVRLPGVIMS